MVVEPFQIIALTLFLSLIGILLWKTRCANCGTLGFAGYEEIFEETQDAEYKMEYKIFKCKTCGIEKKRIIYRKDPLSASPKPDDNGFYKASLVIGNRGLSGGNLRKKMTRSRDRISEIRNWQL